MSERSIPYQKFLLFLSKPSEKRDLKISRRYRGYLSKDRACELLNYYFKPIANKKECICVEVKKEDLKELTFLLRVYFGLWIEIKDTRITIFKTFPERFTVIRKVNKQNHWFTPKTYSKGQIMYSTRDPYRVCDRRNGIPLTDVPPSPTREKTAGVIQINYPFIKAIPDETQT